MENPYQSPEASSEFAGSQAARVREYEGIARLPYLCAVLGLWLAQMAVLTVVFWLGAATGIGAVVALFSILLLFPVHARLKNMGSNPKWCFVVFIPFLNLILLLSCLVCPEGFADTRQLDAPGKLVVGIAAVLFVLMTLAIGAALFAAPH